MTKSTERELDIDVLRTVAILMVLLDHFRTMYGSAEQIARLTQCSVSVFIVLAGMMSYRSLTKKFDPGTYYRRRLSSLFATYFAAYTLHYILANAYRVDDMGDFLIGLFRFNVPAPSYYVVLYAELIAVSPVLAAVTKELRCRRGSGWWFGALLAVSLAVGYWLTLCGIRFPFHGGAAIPLGGSYLFLFLLGMGLSAFDVKRRVSGWKNWNLLCIPGLFLTAAWVGTGGKSIVFPEWSANPPGTAVMLYSLAVIWAVSAAVQWLQTVSAGGTLFLRCISRIGRRSLEVFLFHLPVYAVLYNIVLGKMESAQRLHDVLPGILTLIVVVLCAEGYHFMKRWTLDVLGRHSSTKTKESA